jgi:hypothetical protein
MFVSKRSRRSPESDSRVTPDDRTRALRDAVMLVLKARGRFKVDTDDGVCTWNYGGPEIRI